MSGGALPPCGALSINNQKLNNMNENINLCEILKDCPNETKFYSPLYGEVIFLGISDNVNDAFPIKTLEERGTTRTFASDGRYDIFNKECLLFPSKDQRDWVKWKCPKPKFDPNTLKPFDKVLVRTNSLCWHAAIFSHIDENTKLFRCSLSGWDKCIPYNNDTKRLVGTKK